MISLGTDMDRCDPLADLREEFVLPAGRIYLDGNSLGALPLRAAKRMAEVISEQWSQGLIGSWNEHDWIGLPEVVGEKIASLLGAGPGQVICTDSISVNIYKLLNTALSLNPGRSIVLSEVGNFPTDLYMVQGLEEQLGRERCQLKCVATDELESAMRPDVAVLLLTQVNFRSGQLHDIQRLTELARAQGILVLWDLAHSAGVIPLKLDEWGVDMAVGCGYKFLNGGPGAPAFLYLAQRHQEQAVQPLSGWMGHRAAFEFSPGYVPAEGIRRFLSGTPGILGMSALDSALDVFERVTVEELRNKSLALSDLFIGNIDGCEELAGLKLLTPRDHASRGSQVSLSHAEAYAISQALIDAGVIVDFRTPDVIRFGFSPLYNRFVDVIGAVEALKEVFTTEVYREDRFRQRRTVT